MGTGTSDAGLIRESLLKHYRVLVRQHLVSSASRVGPNDQFLAGQIAAAKSACRIAGVNEDDLVAIAREANSCSG